MTIFVLAVFARCVWGMSTRQSRASSTQSSGENASFVVDVKFASFFSSSSSSPLYALFLLCCPGARGSLLRASAIFVARVSLNALPPLVARGVRRDSAAAAPVAAGTMDVFQALQEVLKKSLIHDGVVRGLRESVKALDRRQAHLCVLAGNCDEPNYVALVRALCDEHDIKLIKVPESKQLGEW
jgi:hypothetical protein